MLNRRMSVTFEMDVPKSINRALFNQIVAKVILNNPDLPCVVFLSTEEYTVDRGRLKNNRFIVKISD